MNEGEIRLENRGRERERQADRQRDVKADRGGEVKGMEETDRQTDREDGWVEGVHQNIFTLIVTGSGRKSTHKLGLSRRLLSAEPSLQSQGR